MLLFTYINYICKIAFEGKLKVWKIKCDESMGKERFIKVKLMAFTKLRKLEVYSLYKDIMEVLQAHDLKQLRIDNSCEVLISLQAKAELLNLQESDLGGNDYTPQMNALHEKRLKFASVIASQMRVWELAGFEHQKEFLKFVKPSIEKHLNYLARKDRAGVEETINQFFIDIDKYPNVNSAFVELGLQPLMHEMQTANSDYEKLHLKRNSELSASQKGSTLPFQRELLRFIKVLLQQIDYNQHLYTDVDYTKIIGELNQIVVTYSKKVKTRDTKRKNKNVNNDDDKNDNDNLSD